MIIAHACMYEYSFGERGGYSSIPMRLTHCSRQDGMAAANVKNLNDETEPKR